MHMSYTKVSCWISNDDAMINIFHCYWTIVDDLENSKKKMTFKSNKDIKVDKRAPSIYFCRCSQKNRNLYMFGIFIDGYKSLLGWISQACDLLRNSGINGVLLLAVLLAEATLAFTSSCQTFLETMFPLFECNDSLPSLNPLIPNNHSRYPMVTWHC